jgi:hypothetical protein
MKPFFTMKKIYIPLIAIVALFVSGCHWPGIRGNGHVVTDQRPVTEFSDIKGDGAFRIEWHSGAPSLSITTDDNLLRYIDNRIEGKRSGYTPKINSTRLNTSQSLSPAPLSRAHL